MTRLCCILLALAACAPDKVPPKGEEYDLELLGTVAPFRLVERSGRPFGNGDLAGKVWIASFIFTSCPTHCVSMCREMQELQKEFADAPDFRMVATTVDPERDTTAILSDFSTNYRASKDRWLFLTGDPGEIKGFFHRNLKLPGSTDNLLQHSTWFALVDRAGRIRGYYDEQAHGRMEKLRADIGVLLAEEAP